MYKLISFVKRGKTREQILRQLFRPKTPTELSLILKKHRSTISRSILALEKKSLVKCLNSNEKLMRYYQITSLGKKTLNKIDKM